MSYYGPASQANGRRQARSPSSDRLQQYNYCNYREHNHTLTIRAGHFNRYNKRLRKKIRIVPWRDEWELQAVGKALLSVLEGENDIVNQIKDGKQGMPAAPMLDMSPEEAFAMISLWKSRLAALEGLPHAIESTAALAQVYWRDSRRRIQRSPTTIPSSKRIFGYQSMASVMELRLAYSAAIVRCINGFADSLQQQRAMAASVSNLCGQMGIPSWLVDTRHESSHNALPNLEVLRLSASTLLEFMMSEYWIPRCTEWNNHDYQSPTISTEVDGTILRQAEIGIVEQTDNTCETSKQCLRPVDFLVDYEACAKDWGTSRTTSTHDNEKKNDKSRSLTTNKQKSKRKKRSSTMPQKTTILPYDPLFGESGTFGSSDDDDSDGADDNCMDENNIKEPAVNSIWGSSIGTNANRYILLDMPKKKKRKGKEKKIKKTQLMQTIPKKRKGEKSPTDCAKLFIQSISSLQEGYEVATQYLVWGGVGGASTGQGILVPESEVAFPTTPTGVTKCWQHYSPLIYVLSRTWPGFPACMITHLVDCVLLIEDNCIVFNNGGDESINQQELGGVSKRKLYFLSAWINLLLSQRFVAALDRRLSGKNLSGKNSNPMEPPLAQLSHLESLGYPLNSLLDRCRRCFDQKHTRNSKNSCDSSDFDSTRASGSISRSLETILGVSEVNHFGYYDMADTQRDVKSTTKKNECTVPRAEPEITSGSMSLDEMEEMLSSLDNNSSGHKQAEMGSKPSTEANNDLSKEFSNKQSKNNFACEAEHIRRPAWIRCDRWDACAIGTLPGYPF